MTKLGELSTSGLILGLILLLLLSNITFSHTIVKTLPGFPGDLPFKLETGYVGVGEGEDVELFYYFVESERNPKDDPLMIWISGGPGCSTIRAFFYQIGPLTLKYTESSGTIPDLELNPYSWTKVANVIFLDAPTSGFSYTKSPETYKNSDTLSAKYTYEFLVKWLKNHPEFISNPLYITGLSYSGITVPIMVQEVYNGNEAGNESILNIKGYILFNPLTVRNIDFNTRIPYAHQFALLSDELYESTKVNCNGDYINVHPSNELCLNDLQKVDKCLEYVYVYQILEPVCASTMSSFEENLVNPLRLPKLEEPWCRENTYVYSSIWANDKDVQKALHIREGTIKVWERCNSDHYLIGKDDTPNYSYDVSSSLDYHKNLTKKSCRALILSGDHDMAFSYIGTRQWIRSMNLKVDRTWEPWFVKNQVAGYMESFSHNDYSLTFATVKGAGHASPEFKPEQCLSMVDRWFGHNPLS